MIVYIAAAFGTRLTDAANLRTLLHEAGHEVVSRWLDEPEVGAVDTPEQQRQQADSDLDDLADADAMVLFNPPGADHTTGRAFEAGYAFCAGLPIFLFGEPTHIFHQMDGIAICPTWDEVETGLAQLQTVLDGLE